MNSVNISLFYAIWLRFIRLFGNKSKRFVTMNKKILSISRAPEPNDIKWENCGYSETKIFFRKVLTELASLIVIILCFTLVFGVNYMQFIFQQSLDENKDTSVRAFLLVLSLLSAVLIFIVNISLKIFTQKFVLKEKP